MAHHTTAAPAAERDAVDGTTRPILFSGAMVRAILDGHKTQTRRICDHRHGITFLGGRGEESDPACWGYAFDGPDHHGYAVLARGLNQRHDHGLVSIPCPYGEPGDQLWVRETFYCDHCFVGDYELTTNAGRVGSRIEPNRAACEAEWREMLYFAADGPIEHQAEWDGTPALRPSIYMPRWASRITLEVTGVRVERLQDITQADALAEGFCDTSGAWGDLTDTDRAGPRGAFEALWNRINGKRASWASNPWVWVVSFRRLLP